MPLNQHFKLLFAKSLLVLVLGKVMGQGGHFEPNDLAYQHFRAGLAEGIVAGGPLVHVPELTGHAATEHVRLKVLMKVKKDFKRFAEIFKCWSAGAGDVQFLSLQHLPLYSF